MVKTSSTHLYALALGSNRSSSGKLTPARLLKEAAAWVGELGDVRAIGPILTSDPIGPSLRLYANSALIVASPLAPEEMLAQLQLIERQLGRRRYRRWGARRMDIDIIFWSGGEWNSRSLHIPHPAFRTRSFVLSPLNAIAPGWRDPVTGLRVRHLLARLRKAVPLLPPRG
ncbi:MAG TPA: 2-amino-4-hydroxy-6-hydroxymethyldihydropteridine diphosphokinase [Sphingobium sp.]|nr:2-amino-4-hydroxy-6-hydroxymethyldihydropteridine diphosphokinase [Sphingobium sp.]